MKRFAAGVVAAATALSLSTGVASAATNSDDVQVATGVLDLLGAAAANGVSDPHEGSSDISSKAQGGEWSTNSSKDWFKFYGSSYDNDLKQGYAAGTTADILWGVGIAAAVLGAAYTAVQNGLIPGASLPF
ncbi:hypothetical protein HMPREF2822_02075 [Corynebacterium sp. HMSC062E11]|uniref:hypothetical protein n=1 Tax=Corynebacterium sp. HMSC062E11 TaxID=1739326 RepID=UPI0008A3B020|nr:hypothetical protein [Corynebacterium sp. HMSC062E11]MDK6808083.1 hypothetical protein [Corynebacterium aurimucosum]NJJ84015.1 hypothetical protein [Corynebacterium aurimucosum]OFK26136.1 hypothetical protein HMPREF2822_02075 [Corynebacterium sp. HMSC062E11]